MTLEREDIEAIAARVAEQVRPAKLLTADQLAAELQVEVSWVYANRERLGGAKLGPGRNAPIRFDLAAVHRRITSGEVARETTALRRRRDETPLPEGVQRIGARRPL